MIDRTEKPKIPSKFAKHEVRCNKFASNTTRENFEQFVTAVSMNWKEKKNIQ